MNSDTLSGNWKQLKGRVKAEWADLTDDDLMHIDGQVERLVGRLQERYGKSKEAIQDAVDGWLEREQPSA